MRITRNHIERYLIEAILRSSIESKNTERSIRKIEDATKHVSSWLWRKTEELALDQKLPLTLLQPIAEDIKRIANRYTANRSANIAPLSEQEAISYALYYTLINLEKFTAILSSNPGIYERQSLRVLDYGAGPGTASLALATLRDTAFSLTIADNNAQMLSLAQALLSPLVDGRLLTRLNVCRDNELDRSGEFDLIMAGHVFNEITVSEQQHLVESLLQRLAKDGSLLIVESALPEQTRELMRLRDLILSLDKTMNVVFPCTHALPCPMLRHDSNDWCHGPLSWQPPHLIRQLDHLTGFNKHRIKYSAFVLSRFLPQNHDNTLYRVVAPTKQSKIGTAQTLCGGDFYGSCTLAKRDRSESNIPFRRAEHFDLLRILRSENEPLTEKLNSSFQVVLKP